MVLDGPVDTFWVENLNTVLDDSKVLCLSNGERINLTPNVRVMFEVDSLIHTSPATVSRYLSTNFKILLMEKIFNYPFQIRNKDVLWFISIQQISD